ncbi:MAG: amino acid dehydrogenase, partial [Alphaproteobacteria bacterium]|nr:amino acid dehydrogenase [Alphaproteobacteria bacterium]
LAGATVAIQGVGNVGRRLADLLLAEGARLVLADTDPARLAGLDGAVVAPDRIHAADADIFAPCALGAGLNAETIPEIRAQVVAGGANNQLATPADADRLQARGILYCPDYLANAGGIVELHHQRSGGTQAALAAHLESLAATLAEVLAAAARSGRTPAAETDRLAEARFRPSRS